MNQAILSIRVNKEDKEKFENFCENTGMNISTAINMFIKTVIKEQKIPFEIRSDEYEKEIYEKLLEAEKEMEKNPKLYTAEELLDNFRRLM